LRSVDSVARAEEDARDQKSTQHKEELDAHVAPGHSPEYAWEVVESQKVLRQHGANSKSPQSIQLRSIGQR